MRAGSRLKLVLHTTEGSWEGAVRTLDRNANWPHLMLEPWPGGRFVQAVPFDRAAKALENRAGGVETNREGAIQVELVGWAAHAHEWTDAEVDRVVELLRPIVRALGIRPIAPPFYGLDAGFTLATVSAPQRMGFDEWVAWDGVCGHQHVPENEHWDPGKFRIDRFLAGIGGAVPQREDDGMRILVGRNSYGGVAFAFLPMGPVVRRFDGPEGAYGIPQSALEWNAQPGRGLGYVFVDPSDVDKLLAATEPPRPAAPAALTPAQRARIADLQIAAEKLAASAAALEASFR